MTAAQINAIERDLQELKIRNDGWLTSGEQSCRDIIRWVRLLEERLNKLETDRDAAREVARFFFDGLVSEFETRRRLPDWLEEKLKANPWLNWTRSF